MTLAILDALEGKNDSALRKAEHAVSISHDAFFMTFYAYVQATAGRPAEARKVLNDLITGKYGEYVSPVNIAQVQFALGEKEAGFESLEKGYLERSAGIVMEYNWPIFDSARDDPRFKEIVRRLNLSLSRMASKSPLDPSADQV